MLDISVLYAGRETASQPHRYGKRLTQLQPQAHEEHAVAKSAAGRRPIVVWNCTRTCNLRCVHCYSDSEAKRYPGELTHEEAKAMIDDLAAFKIPALLFSGGEPLTRPDLFELAAHARAQGLHVVLSTNGTLIDEAAARRLKELQFSYVGISLDGMEPVNDKFRGVVGAYDRAMQGFRNCVALGQKVGLRLTLTRQNVQDLPQIFDFIEANGIRRACFYHLVPSGRGKGVMDLSASESRRALDIILERTRDFARRDLPIEILTVDNHCDGPYLYLKMRREGDARAGQVYDMLKWNGGGLASSGIGIACIDFLGNVHPDQFWMHYTLGNVRQRRFSEIWSDLSNPLLAGLRERKAHLKGRCAGCRFLDLCGGALRVRADLALGDPWASDPGCYLTDEEIGLSPEGVAAAGALSGAGV
ncbi:MAG: radical SAM protein [Planctomycetes bacterium]|nr:radical SAM protein [Planctomycetota bacterium]